MFQLMVQLHHANFLAPSADALRIAWPSGVEAKLEEERTEGQADVDGDELA